MIRYGRNARALTITVLVIGATGCLGPGGVLGDDQDEDLVLVGTINVSTATTGAAPDPDGYLASLDESRVQEVGTNSAVTFVNVPAGTYGVRLDGYAGNCQVSPSPPVFVTLLPDSTITSHFDVSCP